MKDSVRRPTEDEHAALAALWHDAWHEAHDPLVPAELAELRTRDGFAIRLGQLWPEVRVTGPIGAPAGFCAVQGDELNQLYTAPAARGTGAAASLIRDAEERLRAAGVKAAWLACAIGNARAARCYEKHGWRRAGRVCIRLDMLPEQIPLEVWRYEKHLGG